MARTYSQEEISQMTGALKEMAMQVDEMEAQEEQEAALEQLNSDAPLNEAVASQTQDQQTVEIPRQVEAQEVTPEPARDVDYWKKLAEEKAKELATKEKEVETWQKRKSDADRHLTPVQQENATLKSEVKELTTQLKELMARVNVTQSSVDYEEQEFNETFPDINKRIAKVKLEANAEIAAMRQELEAIKSRNQELDTIKSHLENSREESRRQQHFAEIKAEHPDAELFFNSVLGPAFVAWADTTQPVFVAQTVRKPMSVSGKDYAHIIAMFKRDSNMTSSGKKPTLADTVVRATTGAPTIQVEATAPTGLLNDSEFENINTLINNTHDPREIEKLMEKYEKTFDHKNNKR
jgi:myosin heavy subunit